MAAEATGVGSAVRDAVASVVQLEPEEQILAFEGDGQNESQNEQVSEANVEAQSTANGHEVCSAATEHARSVLESLRDGTFFDDKDLPEQANPGPRGDTALTRALEALENCGTGMGEGVNGASDEEEALEGDTERGRPDRVPRVRLQVIRGGPSVGPTPELRMPPGMTCPMRATDRQVPDDRDSRYRF